MAGACRLGDKSKAPLDVHGCPACPHPDVQGPAVSASGDVMINGAPALRVGDVGIHTACCTTNTWQITGGSGQVFVNGKQLVRQGDPTKHCGGVGKMMEASGNVLDGSALQDLKQQIGEWLQRVQSDGLQDLLAMLHYPTAAAYFPFDEANKLTDPDCQGQIG